MRATRRTPAAPGQPPARAGSRRARRPRKLPANGVLQMRPADSPVPAPWAPTWHLEHFAWRTSVPLKSQLTSCLSIVDGAATMGTCDLDTFEHLSRVSSEPSSCYSAGASVAVTHSEHRARG